MISHDLDFKTWFSAGVHSDAIRLKTPNLMRRHKHVALIVRLLQHVVPQHEGCYI